MNIFDLISIYMSLGCVWAIWEVHTAIHYSEELKKITIPKAKVLTLIIAGLLVIIVWPITVPLDVYKVYIKKESA